ncbi:50S ribosomal protein L21 [Candidatus Woesebacteria bacterium]|nr:50S ribosomal protein L21 [Candidatus Woesebacteria bacterium]QQG47141.1 MAG: 50S ribosomal protein L21 [Candidatus Woesebacteria bacterium]
MKYAVAKIQGKQYKLEEGQIIVVDKVSKEINPQVLLFVNEDKVSIGTPTVKSCEIKFKKLDDKKEKKIYVRKYKAKSRYRKKIGFRAQKSQLLVEKIS